MHLPVAFTELQNITFGLGLFCLFVFDIHNQLATTHGYAYDIDLEALVDSNP